MPLANGSELLEEALHSCEAGEWEHAARACRILIAGETHLPDAWNTLAIALYQQGRLEDAAEAAARATQARPEIPQYWLTRGNIEMERRCDIDAEASLRRAIDLEPAFAEALYRLGLIYHRAYRFSEAAAAYTAAMRNAPDVAEIRYQLAQALDAQGRTPEAIREYQQAFTRDASGELDRRPCFDCLKTLRFESLPEFWSREIDRFFRRSDIDRSPYVSVALKALKLKRGLRVLLAPAAADASLQPQASAMKEVFEDSLFQVLLRDCVIADAEFERMLTRIRAHLLLDASARARAPIAFLCALATQCFNNGFVYEASALESERVAEWLAGAEARFDGKRVVSDETLRMLLAVAAYRPLEAIAGVDVPLAQARDLPPALRELFQRALVDVRTERRLRAQIPSMSPITDGVSSAVRGMYEEHPYPRWLSIDRGRPLAVGEWLERELPLAGLIAAPPAARILVAGCGTGRDALWLASNIADAQVLAVDLSVSSLAYARRMADAMGVSHVEFRQADILDLHAIPDRFDVISSTGVLHHMREPEAGVRVLRRLLRPGGLLRLALYSARARVTVNAARELIGREQLAASEPEIRKFRQGVLSMHGQAALRVLLEYDDFYTMSGCRDLLFHVQEHQFRLPQLAAMLQEAGLIVLGLADLPRSVAAAYRSMFPADPEMRDLSNWDAFEERYPQTFIGMYHLWCRAHTADASS